jgi:hypothetical protein
LFKLLAEEVEEDGREAVVAGELAGIITLLLIR